MSEELSNEPLDEKDLDEVTTHQTITVSDNTNDNDNSQSNKNAHGHDEDEERITTVNEHFDITQPIPSASPLISSVNNNNNNPGLDPSVMSGVNDPQDNKNNPPIIISKDSNSSISDCRIAVVGNVDSGKSTLIGVLTSGNLDNGRGLARSKVFVHNHEIENGRTSCISQHIMGFDINLQPIHQTAAASASSAQKNKSWKDVVSVAKSLVTFIDLAGHEKYLKTTIAGLTGCYPDYALVIINSLAGITKMTKEHLGVVIALDIPLVCIVTKVDMVPENVLDRTKKMIDRILKSPAAKKLPVHIRSDEDIMTVTEKPSSRICPILYVSSVQGTGLDLLYKLLARLRPRRDWIDAIKLKPEFSIDDTFTVTGVGVVISGTVRQGIITPNLPMLIGPVQEGDHSSWKEVLVRTIHCKRCPVESVQAGNSCALSLRAVKRKDADFLKRQHLRRGMVLVDPELNPQATRMFDAEVLVLHHPTTIKLGYQAVIHAGIIRQTACIVHISSECLRTGDRATVRFRFLSKDEYVHTNTTFVFREGSTKGIGRIVKIDFTPEEYSEAAKSMEDRKAKWHARNSQIKEEQNQNNELPLDQLSLQTNTAQSETPNSSSVNPVQSTSAPNTNTLPEKSNTNNNNNNNPPSSGSTSSLSSTGSGSGSSATGKGSHTKKEKESSKDQNKEKEKDKEKDSKYKKR